MRLEACPPRIEGWESRLAAVLEAARHAPYELGEHDCFRLVCRVIEALTGVDRWPTFAGYRTRGEALRAIATFGSSFEAAFDWFFGAPAVAVATARRGDVLAIATPDGDKHLGVCVGAQAAFLAPQGLLFVPTASCLCAWRVG